MTTHVYHADVHEVGLQDGCPRCAELAEAPYERLDGHMLDDLEARVADCAAPRSRTEARALEVVRAQRPLVRGEYRR